MPEILTNYPLQKHNSFHLKALASKFSTCKSVQELQELINHPDYKNNKTLILGEGSNILFSSDFDGLVVRPLILGREILREDRDHVWIRVGAGENWDEFVGWSTAWGYGGIENLSLIPGSVGSSPIQNIGAYGAEVEQCVEEVSAVDAFTGQKMSFLKEACRFGYRDSIFKREWKNKCIITSVIFKLSKNPELNLSYKAVSEELAHMQKRDVESVREAIIKIRRSKLPDPDEIGNAGSFFKNPVIPLDHFEELKGDSPDIPSYPASAGSAKIPAAWLIERTGWKGKRKGDAGSYEKQALVLVNHGKATGKEILELAGQIEEDVFRQFGIRLEKEVNVI
jgi:UDP-N-acetylmuramate dehydrogenase